MKIRIVAGAVVAIIVLAVAAYFVLSEVAESQDRSHRTMALVEEGFAALADDQDAAIRMALEALSIDPECMPALILQGRANFMKGKFADSIEIFQKAMNVSRDIDMLPEFGFHIGLAQFNLFKETKIKDHWREAFKQLSEAANLGCHRADANIALGTLYMTKEYFDKKTALLYWERAFRFESELEGYPGSGEDGACPHCRQEFKIWRTQDKIDKLYEHYRQD